MKRLNMSMLVIDFQVLLGVFLLWAIGTTERGRWQGSLVYFLIQQVIFQFIPFPKAISESSELEEPLWLADTGAGGRGHPHEQSGNPRGLPAESKISIRRIVCLHSTTKNRQPNTNLLTLIFRLFHCPQDVISSIPQRNLAAPFP